MSSINFCDITYKRKRDAHGMIGRFEEKLLWEIVNASRGTTTTEIHDALLEKYGHAAPGAIYTTLHRLVQKKLVTFTKGEPLNERGGKARNLYKITSAGRTALKEAARHTASMVEPLAVLGFRKGRA